MRDKDCVVFLQWALPRLGMSWSGFRKVRRQVCKRLARRLRALELASAPAYRSYLVAHPQEWQILDSYCHITISRFYRDRQVYGFVGDRLLPVLAQRAAQRGDDCLRAWSAGCGGGEEAYSLALVWEQLVRPSRPAVEMRILATDVDVPSLRRAAGACYAAGSLKDLPVGWREACFERRDGDYCLRPEYRRPVDFRRRDLRGAMPAERFDLILCRNLAFTYFSADLQRRVVAGLRERLRAGGALLIGAHESLPEGVKGFTPWCACRGLFRAAAESPQPARGP